MRAVCRQLNQWSSAVTYSNRSFSTALATVITLIALAALVAVFTG